MHVAHLLELGVAPRHVEAECRDAVAVDARRVDLAEVVLARDHLAAPREADARAVESPVVVLELLAVAAAAAGPLGAFVIAVSALDAPHEAVARHPSAAPGLEVVAAGEAERGVLVVQPPRDVDVHPAHAVAVVRRRLHQRRHEGRHRGARRVHEVLAHDAAAVGEAAWVALARRVEQQPRRLAGARGQHDDAGPNLPLLERRRVDVRHARGAAAVVGRDLAGHGAGDEREVARLHRGIEEHAAGREVGADRAAPVALPAVVARRAAVDRLREDRHARRQHGDLQLLAGADDELLVAPRLGRRLELAVGLVGVAVARPEDAHEAVHAVVVRGNVLVRDRPVVAVSVAALALEVVRAEAQGDPAPVVRAAADHAGAPPTPVRVVGGAVRLAVDAPPADAGVELAERPLGGGRAAAGRLVVPREHVRVGDSPGRAGLEEHDVGAGVGEHFGGHAPAGPRADDADVVHVGGFEDLHDGCRCPAGKVIGVSYLSRIACRRALLTRHTGRSVMFFHRMPSLLHRHSREGGNPAFPGSRWIGCAVLVDSGPASAGMTLNWNPDWSRGRRTYQTCP